MKWNLRLSAVGVLLAATAVPAGEMRTWNFKSGATIEAEIVSFPNPENVEVMRSDGKLFTLSPAYLADADRSYVALERAKQWKEVSVDKLLGTVSSGRYKKCAVSGKEVGGEILITMLPADVEAVLKDRQQQEGAITNLTNRIQADTYAARNAKVAGARRGNRAYHNAIRVQARLTTQDEALAKTNLAKLKADYADSVKKTKATTTVFMKKTVVVYEGLPVWECAAAPKRH